MVNSMTAFATLKGEGVITRWVWEMRGVNARGLDIRMRLPEGCETLEPLLKAEISGHCGRGTINVGLRLKEETATGQLKVNEAQIEAVIAAALLVESKAMDRDLSLAPVTAADLLTIRGVLDAGPEATDGEAEHVILMKQQIPLLVASFVAARQSEGTALHAILKTQVDRIETLIGRARTEAENRSETVAENLRANVTRLLQGAEGLDADRLAQELALLAVKSDVTEELDRLKAHVSAARELLTTPGPIGRKYDFLTQEFNREANTLCSKSGFTDLTQIGLELKTVIDQMREQVQNVE